MCPSHFWDTKWDNHLTLKYVNYHLMDKKQAIFLRLLITNYKLLNNFKVKYISI